MFNPDWAVHETIDPKPAPYALGKVGNLEYIKLDYFTIRGCREVQMDNYNVTIGLHSYADTLDCTTYFLTFPTPKPMYDTILRLVCVRYDLEACSRTIRSDDSFHYILYDINLGDTHTTILSIRGAQIPIYLVRGATDSFSDA